MESYKIIYNDYVKANDGLIRLSDGASIPFDLANTDYQQFKADVLEGAELQDADGDVMTQEEAVAFISTLP
jgi:hypothetical protein